MGEAYLVAVKPSARRTSRAAAEWVAERGPHRRFDSKRLAREWARAASPHGHTIWIQDAHPLDPGPADGYLLARRHRGRDRGPPGEQASLGGR